MEVVLLSVSPIIAARPSGWRFLGLLYPYRNLNFLLIITYAFALTYTPSHPPIFHGFGEEPQLCWQRRGRRRQREHWPAGFELANPEEYSKCFKKASFIMAQHESR